MTDLADRSRLSFLLDTYRDLDSFIHPTYRDRQDIKYVKRFLNTELKLARFDDLTLEEILAMLGELIPLEQTRADRKIVEKNRPIWRDEDRQEGRQSEARTLILRLLKRRFGPLTSERETRITALPLERLEDLGEALLDFTTSADLDAWLARYE